MNNSNVKIKENLTFYRKMANTNTTIMKKFNSAVINKMKHADLLEIYKSNNLNFKDDIERLKLFLTQIKKDEHKIVMSEPVEINTESSDCSEPNEYIQYTNKNTNDSIIKKKDLDFYNFNNLISNNIPNYLFPVLIPMLISIVLYARRSQK